jgi:hypothetical protein
MFSNEYAIVVGKDHPGGWVGREYVRVEHEPMEPSSSPGEVWGTILEDDGTNCLVRLPWQSLGAQQVVVPKSDVTPR